MPQQAILDTIDREIAKLQQVRDILEGKDADGPAPDAAGSSAPGAAPKRPGPPKGTKRNLSEDARARIAAGQKKRWAAKQSAPKQTAAD